MNFNLKQNPAPLAQVFALGPPVERPQVPENRPNSRRYTYRTRTNWWQTTCYEPRYLVSREVCMPRFAVLCSILLLSVLSFGQNERAIARYCPYGCGPYVPLITTPSLSFATVSPNPVGATNATGGLIAGATRFHAVRGLRQYRRGLHPAGLVFRWPDTTDLIHRSGIALAARTTTHGRSCP